MKNIKYSVFLLFVLSYLSFAQEENKKRFLLEIQNVPLERFIKDESFFDPQNEDRDFVISYVRNRLLLIASKEDRNALTNKGYVFNILKEDDDKLNLYKRAIFGETMKISSVYHTYEKAIEEIDSLVQKFPKNIKRFLIGKTAQDKKNIYAIKISSNINYDQDKPAILLEGAIHSNEILGTEICMKAINYLVGGYNQDPQVTEWVNNYEIYVIPVIDVDGHYLVTHNINPNWRKNTHDFNKNGILDQEDGVDLNRNFDFNWAHGGSSDPKSERYRGEYPFSESETVAIKNLLEKRKFLLSITYHSQGEVVYYPWDWMKHKAPDDSLLIEIVGGLASNIKTINGDSTYKAFYGAGKVGQTYNWFYGKHGTFDFVVETSKGVQIPLPEEVPGIVNNNLNGIKYILDKGNGPGLTGHITDANTGKPLQATVWIPSIETEEISRRTSDPVFGRYWRLLLPKMHNLVFMKDNYHPKIINGIEINKKGWTILDVQLEPIQK